MILFSHKLKSVRCLLLMNGMKVFDRSSTPKIRTPLPCRLEIKTLLVSFGFEHPFVNRPFTIPLIFRKDPPNLKRTCPSMLPKSKILTSDSILLLVLLLSISGVGKKSQKFQNCLRIPVIIFNFSGVNLEGCNHLWKCGQKMSKFYSILGVGNAQFNMESPLMKIESWNLPHWWLLYWFIGYSRIVPK